MKRLTVHYVSPACAEFSGWRTRDLYRELRKRPPVYNTRSRRWVTVPSLVPDLSALAHLRGYVVEIVGEPIPVPVPIATETVRTNWKTGEPVIEPEGLF